MLKDKNEMEKVLYHLDRTMLFILITSIKHISTCS